MNGILITPHHIILSKGYTIITQRLRCASNFRRPLPQTEDDFSSLLVLHSLFSFKSFFYRFYSQLRSFSFTRDLRSHCHHRPQLCRYISILLLPPSPSSFMLHIFFVLKQGLQFQNKQLHGTNGII